MHFITGKFKRKLYEDRDSRFYLYLFEMESRNIKVIYKGSNAPETGENFFTLRGNWQQSQIHGTQFYVNYYELAYSFRKRNKEKIQEILDLVATA